MANKKITDLTALTSPAATDVLPIVDQSETSASDKNKKIAFSDILSNAPDGSATAPSFAFLNDPNTGWASNGADGIQVVTGGAPRLLVADTGVTIPGNLEVQGTTTTIDTTTLTIKDKNIEVAKGNGDDAAVDGAGITIDSTDGDKTWNWVDSTDAWTSSEHIDLASGKVLKVAGTQILSATQYTGNSATATTATTATNVTVADESSDVECFPTFVTGATGNLPPKTGTNLTFNSSSGVLTATGFAGALTGNVTGDVSGSSGSCTGNAATSTESTNVTVTANNSTDETVYPLFVDGATGTQGAETDTGLNYNPSTGNLTSTLFTGNITGDLTGTASTATEATNFTVTANNSTDETVYPVFVDGATGAQGAETDTGLSYNPSTGNLTSTLFTGNVTGNLTGTASTAALITVATEATDTSCNILFTTAGTGTLEAKSVSSLTFNSNTGALTATSFVGALTGNVTGNCSGTATTAELITVATESSDTSCNVLFTTAGTGTLEAKSVSSLTFNSSSGALTATSFVGNLTGNVTGNTSGSSGSCTGNAATATALATARAINGVDFDGTGAITVTAAAGTLSGTELKSTVVTSSLTSVGTLASLTTSGNVTVGGDLTVNGTTTTIDTTNLDVEDKNVTLGKVSSPTDTTADGGGWTLKGTSDKTFNWVNSTDAWTSSEHIDLASGKVLKIAGTEVLSASDYTGTAATATTATNFTVSANNSTDETVYPVFVDGATGGQGAETDTGLTYNPSTGVLTSTVFTGNLTGNVTGNTSGSSGSCTGNAATATEATSVTVSANNSTDETVYPVFVDGATGTQGAETDTALTYNPSSGLLTSTSFAGNLTGNVTGNTSGSSGSCTGNAATATALATARAINGVDFDGTGAITVTAAAGTLTGTELKSTVVTSSLTSVGTLSALSSGAITTTGHLSVDNDKEVRFYEADSNGSAYVGIKGATDKGSEASYTVSLPADAPTANQILKADASTPTNLTWVTDSGGIPDTGGTFTGKVTHNYTSSLRIASGTTGQRDGSPGAGDFRFNTSNSEFEGYDGSSWGSIGGGGETNFKYLALRNAANDGAASYPAADFTLVTSGTTTAINPNAANALLVSVAGVIQQPNTGGSTPSDGFAISGSTIKFAANIAAAPDFIIYQKGAGVGNASTVTVADESSDTSCNVLFTTAATGDLAPKSGTNLTFNSSSGALTATSFVGALTGNVTGNVTGNTSGSAGSCTGNAATATTSGHVTVTDNESTNENNLIPFVEDAATSTGSHGLEMDGDFHYNPSTGTVTATAFAGSGANLTGIASTSLDGCGYQNDQTISSGTYTIAANKGMHSVGPITNNGTVTVNGTWLIS